MSSNEIHTAGDHDTPIHQRLNQQQTSNDDDDHPRNSQPGNITGFLREIRLAFTPYLPPPVVSLIHAIDHHPQILKWMPSPSAEPSMTILGSLLFLFVLKRIISTCFFSPTKSSKGGIRDMIHDAPQDQVLKHIMINSHSTTGDDVGSTSYKDTVILFGPSGSGKSLLFYKIANIVQHSLKEEDNDSSSTAALQENIDTVMSLRANVQIVQSSSPSVGQTNEANDCRNVRLIDYPGHKTLFPKLLDLLLPHGNGNTGGSACTSCVTNTTSSSRALLVVDSTKSVGEAAWMLYNILTWDKFVQEWNTRGKKDGLQIMVVCNKSDESIAKNWRRIKIQLRNELEALRKVSTKVGSVVGEGTEKKRGEEKEFVLSGKSIDLDDLSKNGVKGVKLSFMSYSAKTGDGLRDLCDFVMNGSLPQVDSSRILNRKK